MKLGRLALRAAVGAIFVSHGTQKLFGWFGGGGPEGTGQFFESLGLRPGRRMAVTAGAAETTGGLLMAAGLATPLAAGALSSIMITALRTTIWPNGVDVSTGGYETLLAVAALSLAETGPGPWSLDAALGQHRSGARWALSALGVGAAGSALATLSARQTDDRPQTTAPPMPSPDAAGVPA